MSTRFPPRTGAAGGAGQRAQPGPGAARDPAEAVALVAQAKREILLRVHRRRLRREDLEDAYSQATLELIVLARRGRVFESRRHVANALEQRFLARVQDRRRALSGRSAIQAAIEGAVPFGEGDGQGVELLDLRSEPERLAIVRQDLDRLRCVVGSLSPDQRLVLACQVALGMGSEEFCRRYGWTPEKYRKVAQRARARLRSLMADEDPVPPSGSGSEQATGTRL